MKLSKRMKEAYDAGDNCFGVDEVTEVEALEAIKERLEAYSQNLYKTYKAESRKPPNGYVHAIPWFLIENKLQWVLTGVDHIQDVESGKDERSDSRIQDEVKSDE